MDEEVVGVALSSSLGGAESGFVVAEFLMNVGKRLVHIAKIGVDLESAFEIGESCLEVLVDKARHAALVEGHFIATVNHARSIYSS